jgi:hypothetical protein
MKWTRNVWNASQGSSCWARSHRPNFEVITTQHTVMLLVHQSNHVHVYILKITYRRSTNDFYTTTIFYCEATVQHTTSKHPDTKPQMSVLINVIQRLNVHMLYLAWLLHEKKKKTGKVNSILEPYSKNTYDNNTEIVRDFRLRRDLNLLMLCSICW